MPQNKWMGKIFANQERVEKISKAADRGEAKPKRKGREVAANKKVNGAESRERALI